MPRTNDTDLQDGGNIFVTSNVECPKCQTVTDASFDTGAEDEDGLAGLAPEDLTTQVRCPFCDHVWEATFTGWMNYGDAGAGQGGFLAVLSACVVVVLLLTVLLR